MSDRILELAGFFRDDGSGLGRPVPSGQIIVPSKIWVEGDHIHWRTSPDNQTREVTPEMLSRFLSLADADVGSVLRFAQTWGVLRLSESFAPSPDRTLFFLKEGADHLQAWRYYARRARALLNIVAALNEGKSGDLADWQIGIGCPFPEGNFATDQQSEFLTFSDLMKRNNRLIVINAPQSPEGTSMGLDFPKSVVIQELEQWLDFSKRGRKQGISDFRLGWDGNRSRWAFEIDFHGRLFSALAFQLALVIVDADSLFSCSGCGIPYIRPRDRKRPKAGWSNYCGNCAMRGAAGREAVKKYRRRRAEAVKRSRAGDPSAAIAAELNVDASRIEEWVKKDSTNGKAKKRK